MEPPFYTYATDPIRRVYLDNIASLQAKIAKLQSDMQEQARLLHDYDKRNYRAADRPHLVKSENESIQQT